MFPIQDKIKEQEEAEPFFVDYVITAKGWRASGGIKCKHPEDKHFWSMLQMVVKDIIEGHTGSVLNESYTSGFARYVRPVVMNKETWRWEELDYDSSEDILKVKPKEDQPNKF